MMSLWDRVRSRVRWVVGATDPESCPECGAALESGYERAPDEQGHWRGVPALVCSDGCGYAERRGEPGAEY